MKRLIIRVKRWPWRRARVREGVEEALRGEYNRKPEVVKGLLCLCVRQTAFGLLSGELCI